MDQRRQAVLPLIRRAGVASLALGLIVGASRTAGAEGGGFVGKYAGVASANGVRVTLDVTNSLSRNPVDGGGPTAEAKLDSLGGSTAFASHPFPGEIPVSGPGVASGLIAATFPQLGEVSLPGYPFYVESRHPLSPSAEATGPGQSLAAHSDASSSSSRASGGFGTPSGSGGFSRSAASVTSTVERVQATAQSMVQAFVAGPLTIGEVVSMATVTLLPDGQLERRGDILVSGVTVAGVPVEITDDGVTASEHHIPFPSMEAIAGALGQAKITVSIAPKEDTPTGVVAPAVRIVQQTPDGAGRVTYLLGSSAASVEGAAAVTGNVGDIGGGCVGPCPPEGSTSGAPATASAADVREALRPPATASQGVDAPPDGPSLSGFAPSLAGDLTAASGTGGAGSSPVPAAPVRAGAPLPDREAALAASAEPAGFELGSVYLVVAATVALCGGLGQLARLFGARASSKEG